MYAVVGAALSLLLGMAGIYSLFGVVQFSLFALVISIGVFVGVSVGASYGLGKLYGIYSHLRSALITGLILACLFTPTMEAVTLAQYAFIAVIAQASKFVLVYKKRHIFNPAALGAFMGGLLQLGFASWWIATPPLFVFIAVGALVVLMKMRQLAIAGIFLSICLVLGLLKGIDIVVLLMSWPLLFMLGFMVTEPSTLPPRKWQTYIVVAIMAILVSSVFSIGDVIFSTPELAIVLGNCVAFILAYRQRRSLSLKFMTRTSLTPTVDELVFSTSHPLVFEAGQYVELSVPHSSQDVRGTRRFFSVTSQPGVHELRLGVKFYEPSSSFKRQLRRLEKNQVIQSTGIAGDFVLPRDSQEKILMIAGGIGITPFISHLQTYAGQSRDIVLLYFAREPQELAYKALLDALPITVHYFVAEKSNSNTKHAATLTDEIIQDAVADVGKRSVYISGPPQMVAHAKGLLQGKARHIKTDYFSGY